MKGGQRHGTERDVEAVAGAESEAAGQLKELEYFGNIEAEGGNGNRAIILSFPSYAKQDFWYTNSSVNMCKIVVIPEIGRLKLRMMRL